MLVGRPPVVYVSTLPLVLVRSAGPQESSLLFCRTGNRQTVVFLSVAEGFGGFSPYVKSRRTRKS